MENDKISTHSLSGRFTWAEDDENPVVIVAVGIGIAPFCGVHLQRDAVGKHLNATLLYFNCTSGIAFQGEFGRIDSQIMAKRISKS